MASAALSATDTQSMLVGPITVDHAERWTPVDIDNDPIL